MNLESPIEEAMTRISSDVAIGSLSTQHAQGRLVTRTDGTLCLAIAVAVESERLGMVALQRAVNVAAHVMEDLKLAEYVAAAFITFFLDNGHSTSDRILTMPLVPAGTNGVKCDISCATWYVDPASIRKE